MSIFTSTTATSAQSRRCSSHSSGCSYSDLLVQRRVSHGDQSRVVSHRQHSPAHRPASPGYHLQRPSFSASPTHHDGHTVNLKRRTSEELHKLRKSSCLLQVPHTCGRALGKRSSVELAASERPSPAYSTRSQHQLEFCKVKLQPLS